MNPAVFDAGRDACSAAANRELFRSEFPIRRSGRSVGHTVHCRHAWGVGVGRGRADRHHVPVRRYSEAQSRFRKRVRVNLHDRAEPSGNARKLTAAGRIIVPATCDFSIRQCSLVARKCAVASSRLAQNFRATGVAHDFGGCHQALVASAGHEVKWHIGLLLPRVPGGQVSRILRRYVGTKWRRPTECRWFSVGCRDRRSTAASPSYPGSSPSCFAEDIAGGRNWHRRHFGSCGVGHRPTPANGLSKNLSARCMAHRMVCVTVGLKPN